MSGPAFRPKVPPDSNPQEWLSAAECATRTGLTVRALRVYERQGLIAPPRSPNGWRRYGSTELARLNSIVILKGLGLTLSQIRSVLADNPPSLLRILLAHADSWRDKRDLADRALKLVGAAVDRLKAQQSLSIDELCELIKRLETRRDVDMRQAAVLTRELINEIVTPEEERAWVTWWIQHPEDTTAAQEFGKAQELISAETQKLIDAGADPGSEAVQELLRRHNEILARYGVRERNRRQLAWNRDATEKWFGIGVKIGHRKDEQQGGKRNEFWAAAIRHSAWGKAFREVMLNVRELMQTHTDPAAAEFDAPVRRVREICAAHRLGDALTLVEWRLFTGRFYGYLSLPDELFAPQWKFIERAMLARDKQPARPDSRS